MHGEMVLPHQVNSCWTWTAGTVYSSWMTSRGCRQQRDNRQGWWWLHDRRNISSSINQSSTSATSQSLEPYACRCALSADDTLPLDPRRVVGWSKKHLAPVDTEHWTAVTTVRSSAAQDSAIQVPFLWILLQYPHHNGWYFVRYDQYAEH